MRKGEHMRPSFTYAYWSEFLALAKEKGYAPLSLHRFTETADLQRVIILTHDVDYSLNGIAELAEAEAGVGATATYFVRVTGRDYNPFSHTARALFKRVAKQGHEIGLHFHQAAVGLDGDQAMSVAWQKAALEGAFGVTIRSMSIHGSWTIPPDMFGFDPTGLDIDNYEHSRRFHEGFKFLSDSGATWAEMWPHQALDRFEKLHILAHPEWWYTEEAEALQRW
jgi:hypothetical protein